MCPATLAENWSLFGLAHPSTPISVANFPALNASLTSVEDQQYWKSLFQPISIRDLTVSFIINLIKSICSRASLTTCLSVLSCLMTYGVRVQKLHILLTRNPDAHKHSSYFPFPHPGYVDMTRKLLSEHFHCLYWSPVFAVNSFSTRGRTYGQLSSRMVDPHGSR